MLSSETLRQRQGAPATGPLTPRQLVSTVIEAAAYEYGLTKGEILSKRDRSDRVKQARLVAMYVAQEMTKITGRRIGEIFGVGDGTVSANRTNVRNRLKAGDRILARAIDSIRERAS